MQRLLGATAIKAKTQTAPTKVVCAVQYQSKIEAIVVQVKLAPTYSVEGSQKTTLLCQPQPSSVSHRFSPAVLLCGKRHCLCTGIGAPVI